jgi:hypothetical protein
LPRTFFNLEPQTTLKNEVWKPIPSCPRYEASNLGRIRSVFVHVLKPKITHSTMSDEPLYELVVISGRRKLVHRLVAEAFIGKCPKNMIVHHKDHAKLNNRPENLQHVTRSQNTKLAYADGRIGRTMKLTAFARMKVVEMYEAGVLTSEIAKQFHVSKPTVLRCVRLAGVVADRNRRRPGGGGRRIREANHPIETSGGDE